MPFVVRSDRLGDEEVCCVTPRLGAHYKYPGFQYGSVAFYRLFQSVPLIQHLVNEMERLSFTVAQSASTT